MTHIDSKPSSVSGSKWVAPDGGWGWVVVFSSFIIHMIMDGITYSMGTYLTLFTEHFNVSHGAVSVIHALLPAVTLSCGPISSMFTNRFGCRMTTIIGSLIASLGFVMSYFVTSFYYLYFTVGIVVGIGFGLIYVPAIVSVGYYFDKRRSFAIGIAVCGTGLGTFLLSPTNRKLTNLYGWEGAFLIKAAFVLNGCVCGLVMRPLPIEPAEILKNKKEKERILKKNANEKNFASEEKQFLSPDLVQDRIPPSLYVSEPHNLEKRPSLTIDLGKSLQCIDMNSGRSVKKRAQTLSNNPSINMLAQCKSLQNIPIESDTSSSDESNKQPDSLCEKILSVIDLSIFTDFIFIFFGISNFFTSLGFNAPFIYIVDQATSLDIKPEYADWLLSTIGISNTIGRVILGLLADLKCMNRLYLYATVLTISGLATIAEPFFTSFIGLFTYSALFGFTSGGYVSITSIVLVDLLGIKKLTHAFGILLVFQGVATAIGPPIVGVLYDIFESYIFPFIFTGMMITISGLMCFFIPCFSCYKKPEDIESEESIN